MSAVHGISGGDPSFRADDGSADPAVCLALAAYAAGEGSEHAALAALNASRLLVPVVAVLAAEPPRHEQPPGSTHPASTGAGSTGGGSTGAGGTNSGGTGAGNMASGGENSSSEPTLGGQADRAHAGGEKASEMALPTLIGLDGRRAIPAFTCIAAMRRWRRDARPVPAAALQVWQAAAGDSCSVVVDVGGPVPFAVEGARLAVLARGDGPPEAWDDPDVREAVASVLAGQLEVAAFDLRPGDADNDLVIALSLAPGQLAGDVAGLAAQVTEAVRERLGGRFRRGVAIWLGAAR